MKIIKAISLWQVWASLVAICAKRFETRSYPPMRYGVYPGDLLAIHAAKKWTMAEKEYFERPIFNQYLTKAGLTVNNIPLGKMLCICKLVDVISTEQALRKITLQERTFGNYSPDRFAWELEVLEVFPQPIPVKGHQTIFNWELPADPGDDIVIEPIRVPVQMRLF